MRESLAEVEKKLKELIARTNPDGSRVYGVEELKDALAMLVLTAQAQPKELSSEMELLLGEFAMKIGFVGEAARKENLQMLLNTYFTQKPLNPELMKELRSVL